MAINLMKQFLTGYDVCRATYSSESCQDKIASGSSEPIKAYLKSYDLCRTFGSPDFCKDFFAPEIPINQDPFLFLAIGAVVGFLIGRLLK